MGKLYLGTLGPGHIEDIRVWRNAQKSILRQSNNLTKNQQIEYFKLEVFSQLECKYPKQILFTVEWDREFVGYAGLVHIDWAVRKSEVSFLLNPVIGEEDSLFKEIFDQYVKIIEQVAFTKLNIHRLSTETYSFRKSVIAILEQNNFRKEGTLKDSCIVEGIYFDSLIHSKISSTIPES